VNRTSAGIAAFTAVAVFVIVAAGIFAVVTGKQRVNGKPAAKPVAAAAPRSATRNEGAKAKSRPDAAPAADQPEDEDDGPRTKPSKPRDRSVPRDEPPLTYHPSPQPIPPYSGSGPRTDFFVTGRVIEIINHRIPDGRGGSFMIGPVIVIREVGFVGNAEYYCNFSKDRENDAWLKKIKEGDIVSVRGAEPHRLFGNLQVDFAHPVSPKAP
jgi:hypothetical protein